MYDSDETTLIWNSKHAILEIRSNDEMASQRKKQEEAQSKANTQTGTGGNKINTSSLMNKMRSPKF